MSFRAAHLSDAATAGQVLAAVCADALRLIEAHRSKLTKASPKELHQVRIGLRKLDTAIRLFSSIITRRSYKLILKELRWLRGELSYARCLDVFNTDILAPSMNESEDTLGVSALRRACRRELNQAYVQAMTALSSARFRRLVGNIRKWMRSLESSKIGTARADLPAADVAASAFKAMAKKMKMGRIMPALGHRDLHRLRLRTKRMRYAAEFASTIFGEDAAKRTRKITKALRHLQTDLGGITDTESHVKIFNDLTESIGQSMPEAGDRANRTGLLTQLVGDRERKRKMLLKKAAADYRMFEMAEPFWTGYHR